MLLSMNRQPTDEDARHLGHLPFSHLKLRMAQLLKRFVSVLENDVPQMQWRYDGQQTMIYTPMDHGESSLSKHSCI